MTVPDHSTNPPRPDRTPLLRGALSLVAVGVIAVLAVVRAGRVYGGAFELRSTGAVAGAVLLTAWCVLWRRWGAGRTAVAAVVGLVAYLAVAVYAVSSIGISGISDLGRHLLDGWATALSVTVPVPDLPETTAYIVGAVWIASAVAAGLALRARRPGWSAVPLLLLHLLAVALEVGAGDVDRTLVAVSVAAFLALLVVTAPPSSDDRVLGPGRLRAVLTVGACVLVGMVLAPVVPGADLDDPYDPREQQVLQEAEVEGLNPLGLVRGWLIGEDRELFTIDTPQPVDVQLAALDGYDGTAWTVQGSFRGASGALPPGQAMAIGETVDYRIELAPDNPLALLPTVPRVSVIDVGMPLLFERDTGNVLLADKQLLGPSDVSYEASSQLRASDEAAIDAALVPTTAETSSLRSAPGIPDALAQFAQNVTRDEVLPSQRARALEAYLGENLAYSDGGTEAPPGQAYSDLERMLTTRGGAYGSPDQAATAFAVLGRSLGLPTRVVVGFRDVPAGATSVGTSDVDVWAEVLYEGVGWVAYDPSPPADEERTPPEQPLTELVEPPSTGGPTETTQPPEEPEQPADEADGGGTGGWLVPLLLVLLVASPVLWVVSIALVKRQRRLRRAGVSETNQRVQGAWWELVDVLDEHRVPHDPAATTFETGERARLHLDGQADDVVALAALVDACRFGGLDPDPADADHAWQTVDACRQHLRSTQDRRARVLGAFDPRTILPADRRTQTKRPPRNRQ